MMVMSAGFRISFDLCPLLVTCFTLDALFYIEKFPVFNRVLLRIYYSAMGALIHSLITHMRHTRQRSAILN